MGHCRVAAGEGRLRHRDQSLPLDVLFTLLEENTDIREDLDKANFPFKSLRTVPNSSAESRKFTASTVLIYTLLNLQKVDVCGSEEPQS